MGRVFTSHEYVHKNTTLVSWGKVAASAAVILTLTGSPTEEERGP